MKKDKALAIYLSVENESFDIEIKEKTFKIGESFTEYAKFIYEIKMREKDTLSLISYKIDSIEDVKKLEIKDSQIHLKNTLIGSFIIEQSEQTPKIIFTFQSDVINQMEVFLYTEGASAPIEVIVNKIINVTVEPYSMIYLFSKAENLLYPKMVKELYEDQLVFRYSEPRSEVDKQFHLEREVIVRSDDSKTKKLVSVRVYRNDETTPLIDVSKEFMAEKVN